MSNREYKKRTNGRESKEQTSGGERFQVNSTRANPLRENFEAAPTLRQSHAHFDLPRAHAQGGKVIGRVVVVVVVVVG